MCSLFILVGPRVTGDDPISLWIEHLRQGDELAARNLWNHFFQRLHESARHKLRLVNRSAYDEEDAAQSAFHSVCARISAGHFPDLQDRDSLWQLMLVITARKVSHRIRHDMQQHRDLKRNLTVKMVDSGMCRLARRSDNAFVAFRP